jgi:hypothetical protein
MMIMMKMVAQIYTIRIIHIFKSHVNIDPVSYIKLLGLMGDILAVKEKISKGINFE